MCLFSLAAVLGVLDRLKGNGADLKDLLYQVGGVAFVILWGKRKKMRNGLCVCGM